MSSPGDRSLLDLWRSGDQQAARQLVDRYGERLLALAKRRIGQRLARRVDPEDVVQSAFRTFFARAKEGAFTVDAPNDLFKLLLRITVHKVLRQASFHQAAKRDVNLEAQLKADSGEPLAQMLDGTPTPEAVNSFLDQLAHLFGRLNEEERRVLEMRMQGHTNEQIAKELQTYERKVYRIMEHIRGLAEQELAE